MESIELEIWKTINLHATSDTSKILVHLLQPCNDNFMDFNFYLVLDAIEINLVFNPRWDFTRVLHQLQELALVFYKFNFHVFSDTNGQCIKILGYKKSQTIEEHFAKMYDLPATCVKSIETNDKSGKIVVSCIFLLPQLELEISQCQKNMKPIKLVTYNAEKIYDTRKLDELSSMLSSVSDKNFSYCLKIEDQRSDTTKKFTSVCYTVLKCLKNVASEYYKEMQNKLESVENSELELNLTCLTYNLDLTLNEITKIEEATLVINLDDSNDEELDVPLLNKEYFYLDTCSSLDSQDESIEDTSKTKLNEIWIRQAICNHWISLHKDYFLVNSVDYEMDDQKLKQYVPKESDAKKFCERNRKNTQKISYFAEFSKNIPTSTPLKSDLFKSSLPAKSAGNSLAHFKIPKKSTAKLDQKEPIVPIKSISNVDDKNSNHLKLARKIEDPQPSTSYAGFPAQHSEAFLDEYKKCDKIEKITYFNEKVTMGDIILSDSSSDEQQPVVKKTIPVRKFFKSEKLRQSRLQQKNESRHEFSTRKKNSGLLQMLEERPSLKRQTQLDTGPEFYDMQRSKREQKFREYKSKLIAEDRRAGLMRKKESPTLQKRGLIMVQKALENQQKNVHTNLNERKTPPPPANISVIDLDSPDQSYNSHLHGVYHLDRNSNHPKLQRDTSNNMNANLSFNEHLNHEYENPIEVSEINFDEL